MFFSTEIRPWWDEHLDVLSTSSPGNTSRDAIPGETRNTSSSQSFFWDPWMFKWNKKIPTTSFLEGFSGNCWIFLIFWSQQKFQSNPECGPNTFICSQENQVIKLPSSHNHGSVENEGLQDEKHVLYRLWAIFLNQGAIGG